MEETERSFHTPFKPSPSRIDPARAGLNLKKSIYRMVTFGVLLLAWYFAARHYNNQLLLPTPWDTLKSFFFAVQDVDVLKNLLITLSRVVTGLGIALAIGLTLGFAMGYSLLVSKLIDPIIGPLRQVPIMAWVPLTIVWFGLGDGPTLFLIAMVGVFPILLNTMAGVRSVPKNYYHAARSLGAGGLIMFFRITLPSALPDMITGLRIGLSAGWMSVI